MTIALDSEAGLRRHSGLGIASFAVGTFSTLSFILLAGYASAFNKTGSANAMIGEGLVLVWTMILIGIGLGIAGAVHRSSSKTFAILGLVLNLGMLTLSVGLLAIGLRMQ